ncbi:hypothetical protein CFP56_017120 [Quercus suber]|uniref:Uncharacterized protein n=1 Tax=Quercus suber TaxID=58331 RepID=A0AAW0M0P7_QUESU
MIQAWEIMGSNCPESRSSRWLFYGKLVTHGLSSIKNVDVEKGKHDTLIKNKDDFYAFLAGALHTSASSTS